jgi:tetratricopeptide (TPR) repeat protein
MTVTGPRRRHRRLRRTEGVNLVGSRVPGYLGRILDADGAPLGTCFQVRPGVLVTAWHVLVEAGAENQGASVLVDGLPPDGVGAEPAEVLLTDPLHDLAVLRRSVPLPASAGPLAATDQVGMDVVVEVTGHVVVDDPEMARPRYLVASGRWAGGTTREDAVAVGRMKADDTMTGMSGAPVRRRSDGAVVGVVSARYNSADGWLRDSVWVARTEDLLPLLHQIPDTQQLALAGQPALTETADLLLTVNETTVQLHGGGRVIEAPHRGVSDGLIGAIGDVRRARARTGTHRAVETTTPRPGTGAAESMRRAGRLLADSFIQGPVADALAEVVRAGEASSMPVRLGISVDPTVASWSMLPWEALPVPGTDTPVALHRLVTVYRKAASSSAVRKVAGPLRIVVAIAAPTGGGGVLDYERELRTVLAAVRGARAGTAQVRIVPFATTSAIRQALDSGQVHVLHVSGHGGPGVLELETDTGSVRKVTASEFLDEAIPAGKMPPVICLAACYTNVPPGTDPNQATAASFAQDLSAHGAAAVIGTETSVTDTYATRLFARVYTELSTADVPDVVAAVGQARRVVQRELSTSTRPREKVLAGFDEWGVVTVLAATPCVIPVDPDQPPTIETGADSGRATIAGLLARDPGEFVGRRQEQRQLPIVLTGGTLNGTQHHGVLLHGIGGIGKTTLAAEITRRTLETQPTRLIAGITGTTGIEALLTTVIQTIRLPLLRAGASAGPLLQALDLVARSDLTWTDRLDLLRPILDQIPLLLVLDNFEDNLTDPSAGNGAPGNARARTIRDEALSGLLAAWVTQPGASRVLITCRYPFTLPDDAEQFLLDRALGPLTEAETMKLAWALPRLDALDETDLEKVWRMVGGHPRTLEYLDALLAQGQGRFPDITRRLQHRVNHALGAQAASWLTATRTLDTALADAVTIAADDVLLPDLLTGIKEVPGAERALLGLSVYREPVDLNALLFQIGQTDDSAARTEDQHAAEQRILATLTTHDITPATLNQALAGDGLASLPPSVVQALLPDLAELDAAPRPPRSAPVDQEHILDVLTGSSLLTIDPDTGRLFVHRWTADELARRWTADGHVEDLATAHLQAAAYWRWRVDVWPQNKHADVHDRLEARHHHLAAGDLDAAVEVTEHVCLQLQTWGAWDQESSLIHDMLDRLPPDHPRRPAWLHHLGILAQDRGDYAEAQRRYEQSLEIKERLGDQAGASKSYGQLGILAFLRGDYAEAQRRYEQALEIMERLGDQAGASTSYHQLGMLAQARGDYAEAQRRYEQSLEIDERLGDQAGASKVYHQLGMLAQDRGDYAEAQRRYEQSLEIKERLGDQAGASKVYHQLGILAQDRGDYAEAQRRYEQSLEIKERLGDQAGASTSYHQLGILAFLRGDYAEAQRRYEQALEIMERLGDQAGIATTRSQLGRLRAAQGRHRDAVGFHVSALAIRLALEVRQAAIDVEALRRLRTDLGNDVFTAEISQLLGPESVNALRGLLDDTDKP